MARILVVDDQKISRVTLASILSEADHNVRAEAGGPAGIATARAWLPDVIILDVHMPGMDGFEVVERLKDDPVTESIPVIFLTGDPPTDELIVRGLRLGAYDFLSKGCSKAELLARVGVMERIKRSHTELAAIARISDALLQSVKPESLARKFVTEVGAVFRASAAALAVERHGRNTLHVARNIDRSDRSILGMLAAVGDPLKSARAAVSDILDPGQIDRLVTPYVGRSYGSVAVACVRRGPGAALVVVLAEEADAFRAEIDGPLLRNLSTQAAIAIEHALLNERARAQARDLERAITERSRFFASLSHELRTPINAVIGYNHLLREEIFGPLNERQAEAIEKGNRSAQHLLELVDDILDISKIEAGKLEIFPEDVDLAGLLDDTATTLQIQARQKDIELAVHAPRTLVARTDPARVRQIVLNLLSNAVKFTNEGRIDVRLDRDGDDGIAIRVSDTGPGIPAVDHERIFEEFEQGSTAGGPTGTGLGLAISRRLAELLGGRLTVESEVGAGSTFTLVLPLAIEAVPTEPEPSPAEEALDEQTT
jgi:signal transduction histidine kinase/DNA-binding response OmpR family regulator